MALGCFHCLRAGGPDSGVKEETRGETMQQTNSIIRAFTLLEILKKESDETHKLSQKQILALMQKRDRELHGEDSAYGSSESDGDSESAVLRVRGPERGFSHHL